MMNKPAGVLSATEDFHGTTVIDLIDKKTVKIEFSGRSSR